MPAQMWDEKGRHQKTCQAVQENFSKLQPYTKEWQTEESSEKKKGFSFRKTTSISCLVSKHTEQNIKT